ncbi:hypothetical protein B0J11DRAFT_114366 [Dendryphion nanum]|uniref:Uncharacterized protein n=1 Tax=Dendryphion nanum TaxID=256645 RepID=A0A9P9IC09_9PLEO|nr:hypothetical protein B0J11DRAFT_114366 [Dendryphion nanum]
MWVVACAPQPLIQLQCMIAPSHFSIPHLKICMLINQVHRHFPFPFSPTNNRIGRSIPLSILIKSHHLQHHTLGLNSIPLHSTYAIIGCTPDLRGTRARLRKLHALLQLIATSHHIAILTLCSYLIGARARECENQNSNITKVFGSFLPRSSSSLCCAACTCLLACLHPAGSGFLVLVHSFVRLPRNVRACVRASRVRFALLSNRTRVPGLGFLWFGHLTAGLGEGKSLVLRIVGLGRGVLEGFRGSKERDCYQ